MNVEILVTHKEKNAIALSIPLVEGLSKEAKSEVLKENYIEVSRNLREIVRKINKALEG